MNRPQTYVCVCTGGGGEGDFIYLCWMNERDTHVYDNSISPTDSDTIKLGMLKLS